jgi:outer membrane protein OmpA-like peptidoglycan-associated protein
VNTPYNDICPRLHADGNTLYFSSDGHLGMGGLDLFVSRRSPDGTWGEPTNMGYPINSTQDDFGLAVSPDGKTGYMGRGGLYENRGIRLFGYGLPVEVQPEPIQWFEAVALDDRTGKSVRASWRMEANRLFQGTDFEGPRYSTGLLPQRSYSLQVAAPGYNLVSDRFEVGAIGARIEKTYRLVPLEDNQRVVLQNILFQTDSTRIQPVAKSELDAVARWLSVNPKVNLVLEGHTDNQGAAAYNRSLSQGRAESVKKALVERGIDASRLEAKGYGPDRPVAPNTTPEGRALNRRTEMLIKSK